MRISNLSTLIGATLLLAGSVGSAQNLVPNSSFDTDLSGWLPNGPVAWDSLDAEGSGHSGSAKVTNNAGISHFSVGLYSPCVPVAPGTRYSYGGKFFIPSGQSDSFGTVFLVTYDSGDCSGTSNGGGSLHSTSETDAWESVFDDNQEIPAGVHSVQIVPSIGTGSHALPSVVGYFDDVFLIKGSVTAPCAANDTTLCLNGGRYRVTARWRSHSDSGDGHAESLTSDTGTFWFFSSNNVELIIKVVNACVNPFNRYWVFIAGLTNVEVTITVVDTQTGEVRTYVNPLDQAFAPIQDTQAFATCP